MSPRNYSWIILNESTQSQFNKPQWVHVSLRVYRVDTEGAWMVDNGKVSISALIDRYLPPWLERTGPKTRSASEPRLVAGSVRASPAQSINASIQVTAEFLSIHLTQVPHGRVWTCIAPAGCIRTCIHACVRVEVGLRLPSDEDFCFEVRVELWSTWASQCGWQWAR